MKVNSILFITAALFPLCGWSQGTTDPLIVPAGTPFPVQIDGNVPMRVGIPLRAQLLYPVYSGSTLILPAHTTLLGTVASLRPDRSRRIHARLNADFTPFYTPSVRFSQILLADGTAVPLTSGDATDGAPIFRIVAPPPPTGGFLRRQFNLGVAAAKDRLHVITGPDKADRLKQLLYSQLPYHPQRIAKGTAWTVESTAPLVLPQLPSQPAYAAQPATTSDAPPTWMVQAYLDDALTSASTKVGQEIKATVAEPIFNPDGTVAVPQGATLVGAVTKSKAARRFARAGTLSFSFRELILPGEEPQAIQASLRGADSSSEDNLAMNFEGEVRPKPQDKIIIPALLTFLAYMPMHEDGHQFAKDGVSSNSLGTIGFIVGLAAQSPNIATGIGAYGAARSVYNRILARGKQVTFARDTRIVLETTARRSAPMKTTDPAARPR